MLFGESYHWFFRRGDEDRRRDTRIWDHSSKYFHANRVDPIFKITPLAFECFVIP